MEKQYKIDSVADLLEIQLDISNSLHEEISLCTVCSHTCSGGTQIG